MKKAKTTKKYYKAETPPPDTISEPEALYATFSKSLPHAIGDFTFKQFEKIAAKIPFSQKEWASVLHLSERTLQRYAKENKSFEGLYADRILHIDELLKMGLDTFINGEALYNWLKKDKAVMGQLLNFSSLASTHGIQSTINQISRIQHGVYT